MAVPNRMLPHLDDGTLRYFRAPLTASKEDKAAARAAETASISSESPLLSQQGDVRQRLEGSGSLSNQGGDDKIICIKVTIVASQPLASDALPTGGRKQSLLASKTSSATGNSDGDGNKLNFKFVNMPRSEYLKHFAFDEEGLYIGTEPQKEWTREELDRDYGQYSGQKKGKRWTTKVMDSFVYGGV